MAKKKKHKQQPALKEKATFRGKLKAGMAFVLHPRPWYWNILYIVLSCAAIVLLAEWISRADSTVDVWTFKMTVHSFLSAGKWALT